MILKKTSVAAATVLVCGDTQTLVSVEGLALTPPPGPEDGPPPPPRAVPVPRPARPRPPSGGAAAGAELSIPWADWENQRRSAPPYGDGAASRSTPYGGEASGAEARDDRTAGAAAAGPAYASPPAAAAADGELTVSVCDERDADAPAGAGGAAGDAGGDPAAGGGDCLAFCRAEAAAVRMPLPSVRSGDQNCVTYRVVSDGASGWTFQEKVRAQAGAAAEGAAPAVAVPSLAPGAGPPGPRRVQFAPYKSVLHVELGGREVLVAHRNRRCLYMS